ncbi:MAG: Flp pilus assembly complex ATPase component [Nitrospirae bacterium]|nr:Flp pilus assembly complex ATPase component [Nitrospirota bacterium]
MHKRIGEILVGLGYITEEALQRALELQEKEPDRRRLGEILAEMALREEELVQALSIQFSIPVLSKDDLPDKLPLDRLSQEFLKENLILPLRIEDNQLSVAIADPVNMEPLEAIEATFGYDVKPYLTHKSVIISHLNRLFASREAMMKKALDDVQEDIPVEESKVEVDTLTGLAQEKGIIQLVNLLIENAVRDRASDIHIEPEEDILRVRYRIDGVLYDKEVIPVNMTPAVTSRIKLLATMNIAERRLPQDGRIRGKYAGKEIDIRVSTIPTVHGESIVMRVLDRGSIFIGLEDIGFDEILLKHYIELIHRPYGMILITGPTGSGKSTTLYASLDRINSPDKKIITIEEPVEYVMKGINQINVQPRIGLTFANGLRHIVRQDPDIIMVGEIRDLETAGIAIHAALTGHLIFSTLHTNDAPGAITRLMDMGVENYLVSSTLIGVMAQRLVRRVCTHCKVEDLKNKEIAFEFNINNTIYRGEGCEHCSYTGYLGRIAIFELLIINDEIREMIMEKATTRELRQKAIEQGMRTLREDGLEKVKQGITTIDEVLRVTQVEL